MTNTSYIQSEDLRFRYKSPDNYKPVRPCSVQFLVILDGRYGISVSQMTTDMFRSFPHSWLITGFVTRLTRRMSLLEQELLTIPEHLGSPPVYSGVRVTRSLVLCACFVDHCLSFCTFSFDHCVVCSSIYDSDYLLGIFKLFFLECELSQRG